MSINRSFLNWGVFLIAFGGIPLAVDQGWIDSDVASELGQLWPLILVGIGLGLLLRWTPLSWFGGALVAATFGVIFGAAAVSLRDSDYSDIQGIIPAIATTACTTGSASETTTQEGIGSSASFELEFELPCGELTMQRSDDPTWRVEARHDSDGAPQVEETEGADGTTGLSVSRDYSDGFVFVSGQTRSIWDVLVPSEAALTIRGNFDAAKGEVDAGSGPLSRVSSTLNAADVTFDLGQAETPERAEVGLTLNASDGSLILPAGSARVDATLNASSLRVCAPDSVPLELSLDETLSSSDLGDAGLEEDGDGVWRSPGYSTSSDYLELDITSTVSSFSIERPEACS